MVSRITAGERIISPLSVVQALDTRDALSKALYSSMFVVAGFVCIIITFIITINHNNINTNIINIIMIIIILIIIITFIITFIIMIIISSSSQ